MQVVLELVQIEVRRLIVGRAVDLEGDQAAHGLEREVDVAGPAIDIEHGVFGCQELGLLDPEDLGEQLHELILRLTGLGRTGGKLEVGVVRTHRFRAVQ